MSDQSNEFEVFKVDLDENKLLELPDCEFRAEMLTIVQNGGKVKLKLKVPFALRMKKLARKASNTCKYWWQIWYC